MLLGVVRAVLITPGFWRGVWEVSGFRKLPEYVRVHPLVGLHLLITFDTT